MLSTTIQILLYSGAALLSILMSVITYTLIGYACRVYYSNRGSLPTHVSLTSTHSIAGDPGAVHFQDLSAPVCTTMQVDCEQ